jgi:AcrR family transcriptional regulator
MRAAERLFTSRRFHEITTDEIAHAAHVGKGTIYRHFKDKDDLFYQVATSGFDELCDLLKAGDAASLPYEQQLFGAVSAIDRFFAGRLQLLRMMQAEDGRATWMRGRDREAWLRKRARLADAVASVIARGVKQNKVRSDMPPHVLAHLLLGMLRTRARALGEYPAEQRDLALLLDFFCRGAGPDPGAHRPATCPRSPQQQDVRS